MRVKNLLRPIKVRFGSDRKYLEKRYHKVFGIKPDLDNPKRFTEIMNWIKLQYRDPLYASCADKLAVRQMVANTLGQEYLVPLLAHGQKWADINYKELQEPFIIKTTHGSGDVKIVKDKAAESETDIRKQFENSLKQNYYYGLREWHYKNIPPAIIVEKLLQDSNGNIPTDYKFHCFNYGDSIEVILEAMSGRFIDTRGAFFDEQWNRLPVEFTYPQLEGDLDKPDNFPALCATARKLARQFKYVRVDLYSLEQKIYFGELTFTANSGLKPFKPDEWDFIMGEKVIATGLTTDIAQTI